MIRQPTKQQTYYRKQTERQRQCWSARYRSLYNKSLRCRWQTSATPLSGTICHPKTRVTGLSYSVVLVILGLAICVEHQLVTDGRTDKRTHDDSIYRANIAARRAVKLHLKRLVLVYRSPWTSLKVIGNSAVRYHFMLMYCSKNISIVHRFQDITTLQRNDCYDLAKFFSIDMIFTDSTGWYLLLSTYVRPFFLPFMYLASQCHDPVGILSNAFAWEN